MKNWIKSYWSNCLSIAAIICSVVAICVSLPSAPELGIDYMGVIVGILSFLVTLLIGWQIYNAVTIEKRIKGEVERTRNEIDSYFNKQKVENLYMLTIVNGISQSRMDVMEKKYDSALFCCIYTIDAALKANTPDIAQTCLNMVIDSIIPGFKRQMTKETAKENKANYIQILKKMNDDRVIDLIVYLRSL